MHLLKVLLLSILSSGCNSLFYHPDSREFVTPDKVEVVYDEYKVKTADQVSIALWHMKPKTPPGKAVVVQFHGNAENMSSHFLSAVWLTAVGFHVVSFDYRGYGKSDPVNPNRVGCIEDGVAVLKWIEQTGDLKDLPLFVLGQSLGGAVAVPVLAMSKPKRLKGLILDSTFSSYRTITRSKLAATWLTWPLQWPLSFLVTDDYSPIDSIAAVDAAVLSVHAPADPVVPYELGRELFDAATSQDKVFWDIKLGGHTAAFGLEESKYRDDLVVWLEQRLGSKNEKHATFDSR